MVNYENPGVIAGWVEDVMITEENKSYLTLMRGVGVFQCVMMGYNSQTQEYEITRMWPASKSAEKVLSTMDEQAKKLHVEIRL